MAGQWRQVIAPFLFMDVVTRELLSAWDWDPTVLLSLFGFGALFTAGWWRLRRAGSAGLARPWRLILYWLGLLFIFLALVSPIDELGGWLLIFHMVQHIFLMMLAPPLLMLANPLPFLLWGLPDGARQTSGRWLSRLLHRQSDSRAFLRKVTGPGVIWLIFASTLIAWHDPLAYDLALRSPAAHNVEHLTFFYSSLLFWWFVTGAGPRLHKSFSPLARVAYVATAIPVTMFVGVSIAWADAPRYTHYTIMPRIWGISVLQDQAAGGFIMWVAGSMMYALAAIFLAAAWVQRTARHA